MIMENSHMCEAVDKILLSTDFNVQNLFFIDPETDSKVVTYPDCDSTFINTQLHCYALESIMWLFSKKDCSNLCEENK